MDRDECLEAMAKFSTVKNQIIFLNWHDNHFDEITLIYIEPQNIQPFVQRSVDSTNKQRNYNGPNIKPKSLYNEVKVDL